MYLTVANKNKTTIKGNLNTVVSNVSNSKIGINNKKFPATSTGNFWAIISILVALAALLIQVLIGWGDLIKFFK